MGNLRHSIGLAATATAAVFSTTAFGQEANPPATPPNAVNAAPTTDNGQLEDIVVTAQRRSQNLQRVPISVAAISGAALETRGIEAVTDLGTSISGLTFQRINGIVLPFLRGVGNTGNAAGNEPSVATYVDGVYYPRAISSFFDLKNIERVEVLKGPQGTLFGRNSTGGVINVITRDPSHDFSLAASGEYGRFNFLQGDAYVTGGLTDNLAMDLSVSAKTSDGFGRNIATGGRYGYEDSVLVRGKVLWEPGPDTRIVASAFYSGSKQSSQRASFPGFPSKSFLTGTILRPESISFYDGTDDAGSRDIFKVFGGTLRIEQNLHFAKLISISAYTKSDENSIYDVDFLPQNDAVAQGIGPVKVFTQEVQLVNAPSSPFDWIVGAYYYNNKTAYSSLTFTGPLFGGFDNNQPAQQKVESIAGFAQATYEILPKLKLTGGVRYTHDDLRGSGQFQLLGPPPTPLVTNIPPGRDTIGKVTFKAAVDYQFTDDVLGYVSFSRGYKAGNFNLLTYGSSTPTRPEGIDAYEAGLKSELFDKHVRLNAAGFHYKISNPQVALIKGQTIFFSNAGGSEVNGGEFDAEFAIARGLSARAGATYLDSHYTEYLGAPASIPDVVNGGSIPVAGGINARGNRTPLAAKVTFNVGADYTLDTRIGAFTVTADLYHNSGYFFEPDNLLRQGAYDLLNAQLRWKVAKNYAVRVFGRNLLNEKIIAGAASYQGPTGFAYVPSPPVTYGFAFDVDF